MSATRITDAGLLIEAIRRLRCRSVPNSHPLAWTAVQPGVLKDALDKLMTADAIRDVCNELLVADQIVITARLLAYDDQSNVLDCIDGVVKRLHPEVPFRPTQFFTIHGTPCMYVPKWPQRAGLRSLAIKGIYVTRDGLPKKVIEYRHKKHIAYP